MGIAAPNGAVSICLSVTVNISTTEGSSVTCG